MIGDLRHAVRSLARMPVLATVVVVSLGLGIGVNTVVFSWIQALVLSPVPGVRDNASIHLVEARTDAGVRPGSSWPEYVDLKERLRSLPDLTAFRMVPFNVGEPSRTERTYGLLVSGNYFDALGLRPAAGRLIGPADAVRPGGERVAVISFDYWQTRYGGQSAAIGERLRVNDHELSIVGVAPDGFQGTVLGLQFDMWVPATLAPVVLNGSRELEDRRQRGYYVLGRLERGRIEEARAEADAAMRELEQRYPESNGAVRADVLPFWRASRGPQGLLLQGLAILQAIMLVLLLAVCGNTANLLLARVSARQREMGVRLAVGAGWWRIARLLLVESAVMGVLAGAVGTAVALWGSNALRAMPLLTTQFPVRFQTGVDAIGLLFAVGLGLLAALVFGAAPAVQLARIDPQAVLRSMTGGSAPGALRRVLMGVEVGLAIIVLIAAGLFLQGFRETQDVDPGFRRAGLLLAAYDIAGRPIESAESRLFAERLLAELSVLPDVEAAAISSSVPLDIHGLPSRTFTVEGRARTDGAPDRVLSNIVTPGYFQAMAIPLVAGTDFAPIGDRTQPPQSVVNQAFVARYLEGGEPLGRRVTIGDTTYVIVGVARDSLYESFGEPPTPIVYLSYRDRPLRLGEIHVRTRLSDETMLAPAIRRVVRAIDASLPVYNVRTMTQHVDMNLALRKIPARMFLVLGPLILVVAAIGIYAVVAYNVAQRTIEVGVRLALGATGERVVTQIVRESLWTVIAGGAIGWTLVSLLYTGPLRGSLDPLVFGGVPLLLLAVATLSAWLPARRAAAVDPVVALRAD